MTIELDRQKLLLKMKLDISNILRMNSTLTNRA